MKPAIDETHDPARTSWVASAQGHRDFPIQNLPLGVFNRAGEGSRCGTAIGDKILDLGALAAGGMLDAGAAALSGESLNALLALAPVERAALRRRLSRLLSDAAFRSQIEPFLRAAADCRMHLPARIGDFTDFYAGIHHALNVGRQLRPETPLLPNYKYLPIGYHGRASSIRPSGAPVRRPEGQRKPPEAAEPIFGPSRRLDYELELGLWIAGENPLGKPEPIGAAGGRIAGLCLLNDWSARDFQAWEYQPLGPFLAKNFMTTVSPWIVTAEALAPFRLPQPPRPQGDPAPLPYLWDEHDQKTGAFAIELQVFLQTAQMRERHVPPHRLSHGPATSLYWTAAQLVAHHTSGGCNLQPGDLLGTGTLSAPSPDGMGSLLEISQGGKQPVALPSGETRSFLEDGDEILFAGQARAQGFVPIGFGDCRGRVVETA